MTFVSTLGEGGMGEVVRAHDTRWGHDVAVKTLPVFADEEIQLRQRQEAQTLAELDHPNVVSLIEHFEWESQHYLLLEVLEGGDLDDALYQGITMHRLLDIFAQVCLGLQYIHEQGLVHRDIKPGNILFSKDGVVKIGDLGLVRRDGHQSGLTQAGVMMGTAAYVSPEQVRNTREVGPPGDMYSLGCTMFQAITGRWPFVYKTEFELMKAHLAETPPRLKELRPDIPIELDAVLFRLLNKEPELRPTAAEVREILQRILDPPSGQVPAVRSLDPPTVRLSSGNVPTPQLRILLVDESPETHEAVMALLAPRGHEISVAMDGRTAVDMAGMVDFDLILMSLEVPELSGAEAASLMRAQGMTMPMVAMTSGERDVAMRPCLAAGMNGLILKPISEVELLAVMSTALKMRSAGHPA